VGVGDAVGEGAAAGSSEPLVNAPMAVVPLQSMSSGTTKAAMISPALGPGSSLAHHDWGPGTIGYAAVAPGGGGGGTRC
jgi:hypothetical protein